MMNKKTYVKPRLVQLSVAMTKSGITGPKEISTGNGGCSANTSRAQCS